MTVVGNKVAIAKSFFIGLILISFSATAYATPEVCISGKGQERYQLEYDKRIDKLENIWLRYGCEKIEKFSKRVQITLPAKGGTNRICKEAGKNDAGWDVALEKQGICGSDDGFEKGWKAGQEYCVIRAAKIADMSAYKDMYELSCSFTLGIFTGMYCQDQRDNDPNYDDYVAKHCDL